MAQAVTNVSESAARLKHGFERVPRKGAVSPLEQTSRGAVNVPLVIHVRPQGSRGRGPAPFALHLDLGDRPLLDTPPGEAHGLQAMRLAAERFQDRARHHRIAGARVHQRVEPARLAFRTRRQRDDDPELAHRTPLERTSRMAVNVPLVIQRRRRQQGPRRQRIARKVAASSCPRVREKAEEFSPYPRLGPNALRVRASCRASAARDATSDLSTTLCACRLNALVWQAHEVLRLQ